MSEPSSVRTPHTAPVRITGGAPWEDAVGYSRAVVLPAENGAKRIVLSGCTSVRDGAVAHVGDAYAQALRAIEVA